MSKEDDNHSSTCIICLDILDEKNNDCVLSGNLLQTTCQCKYNIHKDCLNKWLLSRSSDNISCLVCASDAVVITTPKEKCDRNFYRLTSPKNFCKPCIFMCFFFFWIFTIYPRDEQNNDSENTDDASTPIT